MESQISLEKKLCRYLFSIIFYSDMKFRCLVWYLRDYFKLKIKCSHQREYQTKLTKLQVNLKIDLKKIFLWFFFPVKAEIPYFSDLTLGGTAGGLGEAVFYFETFDFPKFFTLTSFTNTKIQSPQVPPWSPPYIPPLHTPPTTPSNPPPKFPYPHHRGPHAVAQ